MSQTEEQDNSPVNDLNEREISDLFYREFKITGIKMFIEVRILKHEQSENFNKDIENISIEQKS